jgi:XTP/dITP diphosphohydrolase
MKIVFATNNLNKFKEVQALLPKHIELLSLKDVGCHEDIPETQLTIEDNAIQKALYVSKHFNIDCFADDTGLEINALDGSPGVYSARYAGEHRDSKDNIAKVLIELKETDNRSAHFKTVIALSLGSKLHTFTGKCEGLIIDEERGDKGFGYDAIFKPTGHEQTFAEMDLELKNKIGHRGKAIKQFVEFLEH